MAYDLEHRLVIGVSSRALFDLSVENELFETQGVEAYCRYQVEHEKDYLMPGNGFRLIEALLNINKIPGQEGRVEVIIMSHNSPDTSLRVFNSIAHYGLQISRAVLASGASLAPYLNAFHTDLYLSADEADVQAAIDSGIAAVTGFRRWEKIRNRFHRSGSHLMGTLSCFRMNRSSFIRNRDWKPLKRMKDLGRTSR